MNTVGIILLFISIFLIFVIVKANKTAGSEMTSPSTNIFKKMFGLLPLIFQISMDGIRVIIALIIGFGLATFAYNLINSVISSS